MADSVFLALLPALVIWLIISGIDDLVLFATWAWLRAPGRAKLTPPDPHASQRWIAVFIPLWQESEVVRQMVTHNRSALRYKNFHFFIGAYPNDQPTVAAIRELEKRFPDVHLALVPHDGPTSKADCLNWIYQRMLLFEESSASGIRFDAIVTHDAEDLIHPDSFRWINACLPQYDMIQIPVLPLPTPLADLVHGVYIDEFSEFQSRDLFVRCRLGGFLPSAGVGTAFSRKALECLAESAANRIFEPACLTEDYENGYRVKTLGFRQILLPARPVATGDIVATREYFPRTWHTATRQRTRWVTGIIWQGMERHGWQGGPAQWWWHWRDRKGLIGNPISLLSNALFLYCLLSRTIYPEPIPGVWPFLLSLTALQAGIRAALVHRYYGWRQALAAPLRIPLANAINTVAAIRATKRYWLAKWRKEPLVWLKTAHQYPNRAGLEEHRPALEELLIKSQLCTEAQLAARPVHLAVENWLLETGQVDESGLYEALSVHLCLEFESVDPASIDRTLVRTIPAHLIRDLRVIPIRRTALGELLLATPSLPQETGQKQIGEFTRMPVRFALVTPSNYQSLRSTILPKGRAASAGGD